MAPALRAPVGYVDEDNYDDKDEKTRHSCNGCCTQGCACNDKYHVLEDEEWMFDTPIMLNAVLRNIHVKDK